MSYFINPVGEDRCVYLSCVGEISAVELTAARGEADTVLDQHRWRHLVVDVTELQSVPTVPELFDLASGLSSNIYRTRLVALVVRPEQERYARIFQKIARRGRVFLTYFLDLDKATLWMKQSSGRQVMGRNGRRNHEPISSSAILVAERPDSCSGEPLEERSIQCGDHSEVPHGNTAGICPPICYEKRPQAQEF